MSRPIRLLALPAACALCALPLTDEISLGVDAGTALRRTIVQELSMELAEMTMIQDGEEVPPEAFADFEMSMRQSDRIVVTDTYVEMDGARAKRLKRTFDELTGEESQSQTPPGGEAQEESADRSSELEGKTVLFSLGEDGDEYEVAFEGEEGDEALLGELECDMDLLALLPSGDVEEGEEWELDIAAFDEALSPGGDLAIVSPDDTEDDSEEQFEKNRKGSATATYLGRREVDGIEVAVIELKAELETFAESEETGEGDYEGLNTTTRMEIEIDFEGELAWNVEAGHAQSFKVEGTGTVRFINEQSFESDEGSFEGTQTMRMDATVSFDLGVEPAE
jgi:hypothetical protein